VLFSFGLLFNSNDPNLSFRTDSDSFNEASSKTKHFYAGRLLKSLKDDGVTDKFNQTQPEPTPKKRDSVLEKEATAVVLNGKRTREEDIEPEIQTESQLVTAKQLVDPKKKKMKIAEESSPASKSFGLVPSQVPSKSLSSEVAIQQGSAADKPLATGERPNTSYIYCSEAQQVASTVTTSAGPENIALLIPASVLNSTRLDASLLEISCQVLNLHMWPMQNISQP